METALTTYHSSTNSGFNSSIISFDSKPWKKNKFPFWITNYDVHGNVKNLIQEINSNGITLKKRMDYQ